MDISKIMKECLNRASIAAGSKLEQLELRGPKYEVYNSLLLDDEKSEKIVGTMLDDCGSGWLKVPGNSKFVREVKKQFKNEGSKFRGENWAMWKDVYKGYCLNIRYNNCQRQEISVHKAALEAARKVLLENGIDVNVHTYID